MPVLLLQGTTDIQVSVDEAKALKAAKPDAELVLIEGMNHVLKRAPADRAQNMAAYSNPDLPSCRTSESDRRGGQASRATVTLSPSERQSPCLPA